MLSLFGAAFSSSPVLARTSAAGQTTSPARVPPTSDLAFAVAMVKPADPHRGGWKLQFTSNGLDAKDVSLCMLVQEAYGMYEEGRVIGGPAWFDKDSFDVEAKLDPEEVPRFAELSLDERRAMLQRLLKERFHLLVHREQREFPVFTLQVAKGGLKLHETDAATAFRSGIKGLDSLVTRSGPGYLEGTNFSMVQLARLLTPDARRIVLDRTSVLGRYDFSLHWTPEDWPRTASASQENPRYEEQAWPSLFTAMQEQLGLKLVPARSAIDVILVDGAEPPSEN